MKCRRNQKYKRFFFIVPIIFVFLTFAGFVWTIVHYDQQIINISVLTAIASVISLLLVKTMNKDLLKKNKATTKFPQEYFDALQEYDCIRIPRVLKDTEVYEYDFIADNTFLSGIIYQALQGNDISKYKPIDGYIDSEYQEAKKIFLEKNLDSNYYQELLCYFEAYEKAVGVLLKIQELNDTFTKNVSDK